MTSIEPAFTYPGISAQGFAHPADRAATAALRSVPMLDTVMKKISEHALEKRLRQHYLGNAVRLGEDQVPSAWALHRQAANVLDVAQVPTLYATSRPDGNAMTFGTHEPVTVVASGLVASYEEEELRAVLGHEMGHVLADHVGLNTTFLVVSMVMSRAFRVNPLASIPIAGLYYALREWSRCAELTSDRAACLVVGDPLVPCRTLMRIAGGPIKGMNLDAFIRQANEYEAEEDPLARWSRFFGEIGASHPFPVRRVKEIVNWVASGEYDRIRSGQYLRRGQEPPPSEEFDRAYRHYRHRYSDIVERAGSGVQTVFDRVSSWLDSEHESGGAAGSEGAGEWAE
jgi:Zn-dependent protease with chaperone function